MNQTKSPAEFGSAVSTDLKNTASECRDKERITSWVPSTDTCFLKSNAICYQTKNCPIDLSEISCTCLNAPKARSDEPTSNAIQFWHWHPSDSRLVGLSELGNVACPHSWIVHGITGRHLLLFFISTTLCFIACNPLGATGSKSTSALETCTNMLPISQISGVDVHKKEYLLFWLLGLRTNQLIHLSHRTWDMLQFLMSPNGTTGKYKIIVCPGLDTENWSTRGQSVWLRVTWEVPGTPNSWTHLPPPLLIWLLAHSSCRVRLSQTHPEGPWQTWGWDISDRKVSPQWPTHMAPLLTWAVAPSAVSDNTRCIFEPE